MTAKRAPTPERPAPEALLQLARQNLALLTELAGHYEAARLGPPPAPQAIGGPRDVAAYLGPELADLAQEQLRVVLLNTANRVLGTALVYQGGANAINIRLADCFREAVRLGAVGVIFVHNHPGGSLVASPEDVAITRQAMQAGDLLGIAVLDHVIVSRAGYASLREQGVLPPSAVPSAERAGAAAAPGQPAAACSYSEEGAP